MDRFALAQQLVALAEQLALAEQPPPLPKKSAQPPPLPTQKSSPAQQTDQKRSENVKRLVESLNTEMRKILDSNNVWSPKTKESDKDAITKRIQQGFQTLLREELVSASFSRARTHTVQAANPLPPKGRCSDEQYDDAKKVHEMLQELESLHGKYKHLENMADVEAIPRMLRKAVFLFSDLVDQLACYED